MCTRGSSNSPVNKPPKKMQTRLMVPGVLQEYLSFPISNLPPTTPKKTRRSPSLYEVIGKGGDKQKGLWTGLGVEQSSGTAEVKLVCIRINWFLLPLHDFELVACSMNALQRGDWQAKSMGYHAVGYKSLNKRCTQELHKQGKRGVQVQGWVPWVLKAKWEWAGRDARQRGWESVPNKRSY